MVIFFLTLSGLSTFKNAGLVAGDLYGLVQRNFLCRSQSAGFALGELAQSEWTNRHADQAENFDPKMFKYAADLAVLAFVEQDFPPRVFLTGAQHASTLGAQQFPAGEHAPDDF